MNPALGMSLDTTSLQAGVRRISQAMGVQASAQIARLAAIAIMDATTQAPIPSGVGMLRGSGQVVDGAKPGSVRFGFNCVYARFQDQLDNKGVAVVRPVRKKWLFIPLTPEARRRHRAGGNPEAEGLRFGGFFQSVGGGRATKMAAGRPGKVRGFATTVADVRPDYLLAKESRVPIKAYGSRKGPNHYFSGTIRRMWKKALQVARDEIRARLWAASGGTPAAPRRRGNVGAEFQQARMA